MHADAAARVDEALPQALDKRRGVGKAQHFGRKSHDIKAAPKENKKYLK
jgi:hypothetical protein